MPESRSNGGGSKGSVSVHSALGVSPEIETHESDDGGGGKPAGQAIDVLKKGDTLGRYLVLEQLGAGAMGVVYAAYDPELDRKLAIKVLRPHEGKGDKARRQERLVREAKAMAKLSHPNVGAIHDVGVHGDQVFLAMEFLGGGTLREWIDAKKRPWREVVKMFIEVGKGLAGAHAEGLIHRDFKPDNVLIDKNGVPKVVDFGLVRLTSAAIDQSTTGSMDAAAMEEDEAAALPVAQTALAALTRTGALAGTPAYMAPEQFLGKAIDGRTDQFAFCVALWEALFGERPFAGATVISIAEAVTAERIKPLPKNTDVPTWVRRCLSRGLRADPAKRYAQLDPLLNLLAHDPGLRLKKGIAIGGVIALIGLALFAIQRRTEKRRAEIERQVSGHLAQARNALATVAGLKDRTRELRKRAFDLFDQSHWDQGEQIWKQARAAGSDEDRSLEVAEQAFRAVLGIDSGRASVRDDLAKVLFDRASLARLEHRPPDVVRHLDRMLDIDTAGALKAAWFRPGTLEVATRPAGAILRLEPYVQEQAGRLTPGTPISIGSAPLAGYALAPGSYRLTIQASGRVNVVVPFEITAGQPLRLDLDLPNASEIPPGFIYVPPGEFMYGDADDEWRLAFLNAAPVHRRTTGPFLISATETTFGDWIAFLDALPSAEQKRRIPASSIVQGLVRLAPGPNGAWNLAFKMTAHESNLVRDEAVVYSGRSENSRIQAWRRIPVVGISPEDMSAYLDWLSKTGRVRGARFCTEEEWERAARGADERVYPAGMTALPSEANVDATYGRKPAAVGLDEVQKHLESRSPFGLDDVLGNAWEVVRGTSGDTNYLLKGGGYYHRIMSGRLTNREPIYETLRSPIIGLRVCADLARHNGDRQ
jgi:formylglycine-generating enzyme required for sulfatase activity/tRNA A-37 threonylcarbamoyl transferase component Bud32